MSPRHALLVSASLLAAAAVGGAPIAAQTTPITVTTSQRVISITPRYQGDLVRVRGTAPPSVAVVLKLTSPRDTVVCAQKGRVGAFWLSVRQVRFDGVPRMFKIKSDVPLDDILPLSEQRKYDLGRSGLKSSMTVEGGLDANLYLNELIFIRERDRRFSFEDQGVHREGNSYEASFFWPPDGPPGVYHIEAYAVEGGQVVGTAETAVEVRTVGVEAWIRDLAMNHGVLYGLFAVALAAVAGLAVSLFSAFSARGAAGRSSTSPTATAEASGKTT